MKLYSLQNIYDLASGDQVFVKRLVTIFVNETPETIMAMYDAHAAGDNETVKKLAHRIKPSIKNLEINSIVQDLMDLKHEENREIIEQKLKHISAVIVDVIIGLKEDLNQMPD